MPLLLNIETATSVCSVALSQNGAALALRESTEGRTHAENITLFIEEVFKEAGRNFSELDAVCVSKGPGSYTGLRIGVSTAKGFCMALGKPLIAVNTLQAMAFGMNFKVKSEKLKVKSELPGILYCPMIDARRMEVYCAVFDEALRFIKETAAEIVDENSFSDLLETNRILFFGDGSSKCKPLLERHPNAIFADDFLPSAKWMIALSENFFNEKKFEDVAYFEPYYLKDFLATTPKKTL